VELAGRSQGFWVGLAVALAAGAICLCALPTSLWIATGRGGWLGGPADATQAEPSPSMQTPGQMPPTKPTSSAAGVSNAGVVWPLSNVPMPAEAELGTLLGSSDDFSVITDQDFGEVLAFYQDEMEALGWTKVSYGTRITDDGAELQYRNDIYHATVILARIPFIGTLVEIQMRAL
jgi:hypothetical protein